MEYRNVGDHPEDLTDGRVVGVGEFVDLDEDQLRDSRSEQLIADGKFLAIDDQAQHEATLAERRVARRANKEQAQEGGDEA